MDCNFWDLPLICLEIGQIPRMTIHKKLLIKLKVLNQIWWSWCYYNEKRCSIQQDEKDDCWSEQSSEKSTVSTVPFFLGPPCIV